MEASYSLGTSFVHRLGKFQDAVDINTQPRWQSYQVLQKRTDLLSFH
jgi:hypothetical protein